ncbi:MAG: DUF6660 family protein [Flavobacteriales bacterium]
MKYFIYILSLFILALAVQPCQDSTDRDRGSYEQQSDAHHHEEHQDTCSPFCSCACCGMVSPEIKWVLHNTSEELPDFKITHKSYYKNLYFKEFIESIIHPPIV